MPDMNVKIKYFGRLADLCEKMHIITRYPKLRDLSFLISNNKKIVVENISLNQGDEIALLPPFSGG